MRAGDDLRPPVLYHVYGNAAARRGGNRLHRRPRANIHAIRDKLPVHHRGQFRIVLAQEIEHFQYGHLRAEAPMRLRQFGADGAAADDDQMVRPGVQLEHRLVGQVGHRIQPGDRRHHRGGSRRDDKTLGLYPFAARFQFVGRHEAPFGLDHVHAQTCEAFYRIVRFNGGDNAADMLAQRRVIDLRRHRFHPEPVAVLHDIGGMRRRDQRLGRHAAVVQAVAAHPGPFHQRNAGAHLRGSGRDTEPPGPGADNADINRNCFHTGVLPAFAVPGN